MAYSFGEVLAATWVLMKIFTERALEYLNFLNLFNYFKSEGNANSNNITDVDKLQYYEYSRVSV